MKRYILIAMVILISSALPSQVRAQSIADLVEELSLDYQKLAGMKNILKQMQQGYQIVSTGYNSVKGEAQGNFSLHEAFLDGLMLVSPTVRKYPRVRDIIDDQANLVASYKFSYAQFRRDKNFSAEELSYMSDVYNNLISNSLQNLDELNMVMSDNKLRMSDNERLQAIDRIYASGHEELTFVQQFNANTRNLAIQRASKNNDLNTLQKVYGLR